MSAPFFFVTSPDKVSSEILSMMLNLYDQIECKHVNNDSLMPSICDVPLDQFIQNQQMDQDKIYGNVFNFPYLDLHHRLYAEKINYPFKVAYIKMQPILSVRLMLYAWLNAGLSLPQVLAMLHQQMIDQSQFVKRYNVLYFYQLISANTAIFQQDQAAIRSPEGQLFLIALSVVMAFYASDMPLTEEVFEFESLLTKTHELNRLMSYLMDKNTDVSVNFLEKLNPILQLAMNVLVMASKYASEKWQTDLAKILFENINHFSWPSIQSQLFMLLRRSSMLDGQRFYVDHQFCFLRQNKIYYELILLSPFESLFEKDKLINPERIKRVKEEGARLLYDVSGEALTLGPETDEYLLAFHRILEASGVPGEAVYLLCSNAKAAQYYDAWADKHQLNFRVNMLGNQFWLYLRSYEVATNPVFIQHKEDLVRAAARTVHANEHRAKHFMCLNLKARPHRTTLILFLLSRQYLDKGIVTYFGRSGLLPKNTGDKSESTSYDLKTMQFIQSLPEAETFMAEIENLEALRPLVYDKVENSIFSEAWPLAQFIPEIACYGGIKQFDSYIEIVTETYLNDEKGLFITEKTLRSFLRFQILIVMGSPFTLKYLKSIGFQTFSPWIDESYDEMADPKERIVAIFKEIDRLCKMSLDELHQMYCVLWPRILHNFEHFIGSIKPVFHNETEEMFRQLAREQI